jgi:hypothetical protein
MSTTAANTLADRFANTLEGVRATMAAEGPGKGLARALQEAILGLLECLLAPIVQFQAGKLVAVPGPCATCAASIEPGAAEFRLDGADRTGHHEPRLLPARRRGCAREAAVAAAPAMPGARALPKLSPLPSGRSTGMVGCQRQPTLRHATALRRRRIRPRKVWFQKIGVTGHTRLRCYDVATNSDRRQD